MGYVKYREDDIGIVADRNHYIGKYQAQRIGNMNFIQCYYCQKEFTSLHDRNHHILHVHNINHPILIVNGKVTNKEVYVKRIEEVKIDLFGKSNHNIMINNVELCLNGTDSIIDILENIKTNKTNTILIDDVESIIFHLPSMDIRSSVVKNLIGEWERMAEKGLIINKKYPIDISRGEKIYLDGIFNYYIACVGEENKQKRYEDAYSILDTFDKKTANAMCVLRVIAFRLNWVEKLGKLCDDQSDVFYHAWNFFNDNSSNIIKTENEFSEGNLYIENSVEEILNAIILYQSKQYIELDDYMNRYPDDMILQIDDYNLRDKIYLIKARIARNKGLKRNALVYYNEIKSPFFNFERDNFIENFKN